MNSVRLAVADYIKFYNSKQPHQGLDYLVPDEMYKSFVSENGRNLAALKSTLKKLKICLDKGRIF